MKKTKKLGLGLAATLLGLVTLSGCTANFCTRVDVGRMMYAFDPGITRYEAGSGSKIFTSPDTGKSFELKNYSATVATFDEEIGGFRFGSEITEKDKKTNINVDKLTYLNSIIKSVADNGYVTVDIGSVEYFAKFDELLLEDMIVYGLDHTHELDGVSSFDLSNANDLAKFNRSLSMLSYRKYFTSEAGKKWDNWTVIDTKTREAVADFNKCPSTDFVAVYKSKMNSYVANQRTCLTTKTDKYGSYGYSTEGVYFDGQTWARAWNLGLFEGLLVYPIGWLIDQISSGFKNAGTTSGVAALLAIVFVTLIVRTIMLLATLKQTASNAKMTELQPEIQKIQNKYPNSNTSQAEKQRMAEEMNRLYKKNKINPFTAIIVMIVQFPVFICVWGALSGSAALANGSVLGLRLSVTIRDALFNAANWGPAGGYSAVTALFLFLLMAGAQTISMLLPQWMQKKRAKDVAKLGKNPAQKSQNNQMKIFTYVMLAMIIFMGFSLASAMGIYWFIGALISVGQTLITQAVTDRKRKQKNN